MSSTGTAILERLIRPGKPTLSPEAARSILKLSFSKEDIARVEVLSARAQEGTLSAKEKAELKEYIRIGDLLALLQSKARLSLRRARGSPPSP